MRIPLPLILAAAVVIGASVTLILVFKLLQTVAVILPGIAPSGTATVTLDLGSGFSGVAWGYYAGMGKLTISHNATSSTNVWVYSDIDMYTFALTSYSTPTSYQRIATDKGVLYLCTEGPYGIAYSPGRGFAFVGKFESVGGLYVLVPAQPNDTLINCMAYVAQTENNWAIDFLWVNGTSFRYDPSFNTVYAKAYYFLTTSPPYQLDVTEVAPFNTANAVVLQPNTSQQFGGFEPTNVNGVYRLYAVYILLYPIGGPIQVSITAS